MQNRKPPSEQEVPTWLAAGRLELPPLSFRLTQIQPRYRETSVIWDFELEGTWGGEGSTFVAEYRSLSTPKAFEDAVRQCLGSPTPPGYRPLLLMPYFRPDQLKHLEKIGLSGVDLCGNGVVMAPGSFLVFRTGQPNRFSLTTPIKNIYRRNTSMVARLFASEPAFPNLKAVLDAVNDRNPLVRSQLRTPMRLGTVSKAVKGLEEDLVVERANGIRLLQADKLLSHLVENYKPLDRGRTCQLKVPAKSGESWLRDRLRGFATPVVATGLSSVGQYAVMAREDRVSVYCPSFDEVRERLEGVETDRFPNVELIEMDDESVYFDARSDDEFAWASPLQTYLELMAGDKRDRETAGQVKELLLRATK